MPRGKVGTVNSSFLTSRASSFKPKQPLFSGVCPKLGIPIYTGGDQISVAFTPENRSPNSILTTAKLKIALMRFIIATVHRILKRFDSRLAIIKGNRLEKRYLNKWRALFRIDRTILND